MFYFFLQSEALRSNHKPYILFYFPLCFIAAMLPQIHYTKINISFLEKFGPVFATEGESATLSATMTLNPNLANLQPEAQWYRDGNSYKEAFCNKVMIM